MRKMISILILIAIFFNGAAHAELMPMKITPELQKKIQSMDVAAVRNYAESNSIVFASGITRPSYFDGNSLFAWVLNGNIYISDIVAFVSDDNDIPECKGHPRTYEEIKKDNWDGPGDCDVMHVVALQCHLVMLTEQGGIAGVGRMQIARDKNLIRGRPGCIDIKAMAIAKTVSDGILITATYIDSSFTASPGNMPDEHQTTILLILKEESPGKLSITQDDSCLGNPNRIASIAAARKRLEQCAKASK